MDLGESNHETPFGGGFTKLTLDSAYADGVRSGHQVYGTSIADAASVPQGSAYYSQSHLRRLGEYLTAPPRSMVGANAMSSPHNPRGSRESDFSFATICNLRKPSQARIIQVRSAEDLDEAFPYLDEDGDPAIILFLHGHASPDWINTIGDLFDVEADFFQQHLDFKGHIDVANPQPGRLLPSDRTPRSSPLLPSDRKQRLQLRVYTILKRYHTLPKHQSGRELRTARSQHFNEFLEHIDGQRCPSWSSPGASLIRHSVLHDLETLSVEQAMTMQVKAFKGGWMGVVWLDIGQDLGHIVNDSWFGRAAEPWETRQDVEVAATVLKRPLQVSSRAYSGTRAGQSQAPRYLPQNASLISSAYEDGFEAELGALDPFHAMTIPFRLACSTTLHYSDTLSSQIDRALIEVRRAPGLTTLKDNVEDLTLCQELLMQSYEDTSAMLTAIEGRRGLHWPLAPLTPSQEKTADDAAHDLLLDVKELQARTRALLKRCERGVTHATSRISIHESQRAIKQAERVESLTRLAFIFIPLSFTASFFGMNFEQLGQGTLPLWVYFAVSVPIFIVSILFLVSERLQHLITDRIARGR